MASIKYQSGEDKQMAELKDLFTGKVTITIKFDNRVMWQRYRKYILKTTWEFDGGVHPSVAQIEEEFHTVSDLGFITQKIAYLLQLGFDVHTAKWELKNNQDIQHETQWEKMISLEDLFRPEYEEQHMQLYSIEEKEAYDD